MAAQNICVRQNLTECRNHLKNRSDNYGWSQRNSQVEPHLYLSKHWEVNTCSCWLCERRWWEGISWWVVIILLHPLNPNLKLFALCPRWFLCEININLFMIKVINTLFHMNAARPLPLLHPISMCLDAISFHLIQTRSRLSSETVFQLLEHQVYPSRKTLLWSKRQAINYFLGNTRFREHV